MTALGCGCQGKAGFPSLSGWNAALPLEVLCPQLVGALLQWAESGVRNKSPDPENLCGAWVGVSVCVRERRQRPRSRVGEHTPQSAGGSRRPTRGAALARMVNKNTLVSRFALTAVILRLQGRDCSRTYVSTPYLKKLLSPLHQSLSLYIRGNRGPRWQYCTQGPPLHTFPLLSTSFCVTAGSAVLMVRAAQGGMY